MVRGRAPILNGNGKSVGRDPDKLAADGLSPLPAGKTTAKWPRFFWKMAYLFRS